MSSIDAQLLEAERRDREKSQRMIAHFHVKRAINGLSDGHPALAKLEEALALLEAA